MRPLRQASRHGVLSVLLTCLAVASHAGAQSSELPLAELDDEDLVILEVKLDGYVLGDNLLAYMRRGSLLLPLGEIAALLDFPILVDAHAGRADGWFVRESRGFHLDLARSQVVISGIPQSFDVSLVAQDFTELYVDSSLLSSWFRMEFEFVMSALALRVHPSEKLPVQLRLLRDERRRRTLSGGSDRPQLPRRDAPYRLATWPSLDLTLQTRSGGDGVHTSYALSGAADVAGLSTQVSASGNDAKSISTLRLLASRIDIDGNLLGPLHARRLEAGDVSVPSVPLVSRSREGPGFFASNSPMVQPDGFGFTSLRGNAPEGWDVELYRNGILTDFLIVGASGSYEFPRVELGFGENVLRSVAYGPQGQAHERVERHRIGADMLLPGQLRYRFFAVRPDRALLDGWIHDLRGRTATGAWDLHGQVAYGIGTRLSVIGGVTRTEVAGEDETFATLGLRASSLGVLTEAEMARSSAGGTALKVSAQTRLRGISLLAQQSLFRSYSSNAETGALPLSSLTLFRATGSAALPHLPSLSYNLGYERRSFETPGASDEEQLSFRLASNVRGISFAHELVAQKAGGLAQTFRRVWSQGLVSGRWRGFRLRGRAQFQWKPDRELDVITATVSRNLRKNLSSSLVVSHSLGASSGTKLSARMSWIARRFELSLDLGHSSRDGTTATLSLGGSLSRDPRGGRVQLARPGTANAGRALARVYLDRNANDRFDAEDQPIPDASFLGNARWKATKTDANGQALLQGVPTNRLHDIRIDPASIVDPYWMLAVPGYSVVTHAGGRVELDFPIRIAGEIEGTVYMERGGVRQSTRNLRLELVDTEGLVVQATRSAFDGYFLFEKVLPERYRIRVADGALKDPTIHAPELGVVLPGDGGVVSGLELVLVAGDGARADTKDSTDAVVKPATRAKPSSEDPPARAIPDEETESICSDLARVLLDLLAWRPGPSRELGECARALRKQESPDTAAVESEELQSEAELEAEGNGAGEREASKDHLLSFAARASIHARSDGAYELRRQSVPGCQRGTLTGRAAGDERDSRRGTAWPDRAATRPVDPPHSWMHTSARPRGPP